MPVEVRSQRQLCSLVPDFAVPACVVLSTAARAPDSLAQCAQQYVALLESMQCPTMRQPQ